MNADFDDWYRSSYVSVLAACRAMGGDDQLARDATDEACSRALARWSSVGSMESPTGWACTVAFNWMRRSWGRHRLEARWISAQPPGRIEGPACPDPEIWVAVRALPGRQRTAVVLRYVADLSEPEVARAMGVTRGAVASTLAAARTRLSSALNAAETEVPCG